MHNFKQSSHSNTQKNVHFNHKNTQLSKLNKTCYITSNSLDFKQRDVFSAY